MLSDTLSFVGICNKNEIIGSLGCLYFRSHVCLSATYYPFSQELVELSRVNK